MNEEAMKTLKNIEYALVTMIKTDHNRVLTKQDVIEEYDFTLKEATKIFQELKNRKKIIYVGKTQRVTQENLLNLLNEGLIIKS